MPDTKRKLLIIGGRGTLGQALVGHFKSRNVWVASVDHGENEQADFSITINTAIHLTSSDQAQWIEQKMTNLLQMEDKEPGKILDGIICVAGGWTGGNIVSDGFLKSVDQMWKQSVESSAVAAYLAGKLLKDGGLLAMTGAQAVHAGPTPTMIGYGMAKAAVHHLIKSLASEGSGLPKNAVVVGLLPKTLDTPNNRRFATESEDFGSWTPLNHVACLIQDWMDSSQHNMIESGSLMEIITVNGKTSVKAH